jgi:hypothetical protein
MTTNRLYLWSTIARSSILAFAIVTATASACRAQTSVFEPVENYFATWFQRVAATQAEQPHWMTPLVTVTPRLEQEYRYDQLWQTRQLGHSLTNYGANKGLELIPAERIEVILGVPGYVSLGGKPPKSNGWADESFLIKFRLLSANEEKGNYILSLFLGISAPTGDDPISNGHVIYTPTIAAGKGWGNFDVQSTVSAALPNGGLERLGMPVAWNTAFQYWIPELYAWPEIETNYTWWPNGAREGKNQLILTPGIIFGRFRVWRRLKFVIGAGYQVAVTSDPTFNNGVVLSIRTPF